MLTKIISKWPLGQVSGHQRPELIQVNTGGTHISSQSWFNLPVIRSSASN